MRFDSSVCGDSDSFAVNSRALRETCRRFKAMGRNVVMVTDCPQLSGQYVFHPAAYANWSRLWERSKDIAGKEIALKQYNEVNRKVNQELDVMEAEGLCKVVHLERFLFHSGKYDVWADSYIRMKDTHHFSVFGAVEAVRGSLREFADCLDERLEK